MIEIITIGDELLSGSIADKNARALAAALHADGRRVARITSVGDRDEDIVRALRDLLPDTRCVVVTGGLGPTDDDRTAQAAAAAFGKRLAVHDGALAALRRRYQEFGRPMPEAAHKQALLPESCAIIPNPIGTASGFCIEDRGVQFLFLPGVPDEARAMIESSVLGQIRAAFGSADCVVTATLKLFGIWESGIRERLSGRLPASDIVTVGYYPRYPEISIRITGRGRAPQQVRESVAVFQDLISRLLGDYIYAIGDTRIEEIVGALLRERAATLSVAESCTGGLITHLLTDVPGSSAYLERTLVVYSNRAKHELLGVSEAALREHGAVSEQVARGMAEGVRAHAATTYGLAVTGIAGPAGGSAEKPVGTVFLAVASADRTVAQCLHCPGLRDNVKTMAAHAALHLLRRFILDEQAATV